MDDDSLQKVNQQVYKQFPYMKDVAPSVKEMREGVFELHYSGSVQTANQQTLPIIVKVTADGEGKIQKLTTSR
jgi:hypothetical protein